MIEIEDVPDLVNPVVIAAFEGWNDAADAASVGRGPPDRGVGRAGSSAPSTRRTSTTSRSTARSVGTDEQRPPPDHLAEHPDRGRLPPRPRPRRDPGPRHRAQHALAPVLRRAAGRVRRPRRRAGGHARRAAGRHPAHPADPGHRHRHRARAGRPAQARAVDVRRARPGSSASSRTPACGSTSRRCPTGRRSPTTSPSRRARRPPWRCSASSRTCSRCSIPLGDLPEDARAWERGVDELAEEDEDIADYVRALEETRDTTDLPEASGEAIAREFERYLKRRAATEDG